MPWWQGEQFEDFRILTMTSGYNVIGRGRNIACDSKVEAEGVIRDLLAASSTAGK